MALINAVVCCFFFFNHAFQSFLFKDDIFHCIYSSVCTFQQQGYRKSVRICTDMWFIASEDVIFNQLEHMLARLKSIQKNGQGRIFPGDPHSSRHLFSKWFQAGRDCCLIFVCDWKRVLKPKFKPYKFPGNSPSLWLPKCSDSIFFFLLIISSSHRLPHYFYFLRIKVILSIGMAAWKLTPKKKKRKLTPRIIIAWIDKGQTYEPEGKWNQRNNINDSYAYTVCQSLQSTFTYMIYNNLQ